jgi:hypothetical protein
MTFELFKARRGIVPFLRVLDIVWCTNRISLLAFDFSL